MLRRQFLQSIGAAAMAQTNEQPRVLLLMASGWRGWPPEQTAQLQRLEREGLRCTRAYATCPHPDRARQTLLTGRYPHSPGGTPVDFAVETLQSNAAGYDRRILDMDAQLGRILRRLDQAGAASRTLVVFTSTSGDLAGAHGVEGADEPFEESARVPLVLRFPGVIPAGGASDMLISHVDVAPTLLGLLKAPAPESMQGRDWSGLLLTGKGERPESVFCQGKLAKPGEWRMLVRGVDKLVTDREGEPTHLFNLAQDPMEQENLVAVRAQMRTRDELSALLEIWRKKTGDGRSASGLRQRK